MFQSYLDHFEGSQQGSSSVSMLPNLIEKPMARWFDIADNLPRYEGFTGNSSLLRHGPVSDGLPSD